MSNFYSKWKQYLQEAQQDAKILRNINIKAIQKEMPKFQDEEIRDYFARIQGLERDPKYLNPIFPTGIVDWMESLPDNHFPNIGRKRFAKWSKPRVLEDMKVIQSYYDCSMTKAEEYYKILNAKEIKKMKERMKIGGKQ